MKIVFVEYFNSLSWLLTCPFHPNFEKSQKLTKREHFGIQMFNKNVVHKNSTSINLSEDISYIKFATITSKIVCFDNFEQHLVEKKIIYLNIKKAWPMWSLSFRYVNIINKGFNFEREKFFPRQWLSTYFITALRYLNSALKSIQKC